MHSSSIGKEGIYMPNTQSNPFNKGKEFISENVRKEGAKIADAANAAKDKLAQKMKETKESLKEAADKLAMNKKPRPDSDKSGAV